ncbi:MAG: hypothetical protein NTV02_00055 [Candidatus Zambryskibacteria bacterium]|nr:hypothetical protein [Candidatus Zambryskibacteria bacterium]
MNFEHQSEGGERMISQEILDKVRLNFIRVIEEAVHTYTENGTKEWVNEENCREVIRRIRDKVPTEVNGPLYGDMFDEAIEHEGFASGTPEFQEIAKLIKEGK